MKKGLLLLAGLGVFAFSTAVFAGTKVVTYTSEFLRFDGCPSCDDPCGHEDVINYLPYICDGIHQSVQGSITFRSATGGWNVTVQLQHASLGFIYQIKSNHYFAGTNPYYAWTGLPPDGKTGLLIPTTPELDKRGKPTGYASGTLSFFIKQTDANLLGSVICVFVDCPDDPILVEDKSCTHWNLLYATNWMYYRSK
jgi:hypothetical protein